MCGKVLKFSSGGVTAVKKCNKSSPEAARLRVGIFNCVMFVTGRVSDQSRKQFKFLAQDGTHLQLFYIFKFSLLRSM